MNNTILRVILTAITLIWMAVIFMFSNSPKDESTDLSNSFIDNTIVQVVKIFDKKAKTQKIIETFSGPVRKLAHFTEYLILGVLVFFTFKSYGLEDYSFAIVACILYAASDEIHQYFVPGRACKALDVLIDSLGSCTGVFLVSLFK